MKKKILTFMLLMVTLFSVICVGSMKAYAATTVTYDFNTNATDVNEIVVGDIFTITFGQTAVYDSGQQGVKLDYQETLTIKVPDKYTIKRIDFNCKNNTSLGGAGSTTNNGPIYEKSISYTSKYWYGAYVQPKDGTKDTLLTCYQGSRYIAEIVIKYELHTCDFDVDWSVDETSHWKQCSCGDVAELEEHTLGNDELLIAQKTSVDSVTRTTCSVCSDAKLVSTYTNLDIIEQIDVDVDDVTSDYVTGQSFSKWATNPEEILTNNETDKYNISNVQLYQYTDEREEVFDFSKELEYGYSYKLTFELDAVQEIDEDLVRLFIDDVTSKNEGLVVSYPDNYDNKTIIVTYDLGELPTASIDEVDFTIDSEIDQDFLHGKNIYSGDDNYFISDGIGKFYNYSSSAILDANKEEVTSGTYVAGNTYYAQVVYSAKADNGYLFAQDLQNNTDGYELEVSEDGKTLTVTYEFTPYSSEIAEFVVIVDTEGLKNPYSGKQLGYDHIISKQFTNYVEEDSYAAPGLRYSTVKPLSEYSNDEIFELDKVLYRDIIDNGTYAGYYNIFFTETYKGMYFTESTVVKAVDKNGNPVEIYYNIEEYDGWQELEVVYDMGQYKKTDVEEMELTVSLEYLSNINLSEGKSFFGMTGFYRFTEYEAAFGSMLTITNASVGSENISQNMFIEYGYKYREEVLYYTTAENLEAYGSDAWDVADPYDILKAENEYIYAFKYDFRFPYSTEYHKMYNFVENLNISLVDANGNPLEGYELYFYPSNNEDLSFTLYFGLGEVKELTMVDELDISFDTTFLPDEKYVHTNGTKIFPGNTTQDVFKNYFDYYNQYEEAPQIFTTDDERVRIYFEHFEYPYDYYNVYGGRTGLMYSNLYYDFSHPSTYNYLYDADTYSVYDGYYYGYTFVIIFEAGYTFDEDSIVLPEGFVVLRDINEWNAEDASSSRYDEYYWEFGERALYVGYQIAQVEKAYVTDLELEFNETLLDNLDLLHGNYPMYIGYTDSASGNEFKYANFLDLNVITNYSDMIISNYDGMLEEIQYYYGSLDAYFEDMSDWFKEEYGYEYPEEWKYISQGWWVGYNEEGVYSLYSNGHYDDNFSLNAGNRYAFMTHFYPNVQGCEFDLDAIEQSLEGTGFKVDFNYARYYYSNGKRYGNSVSIYYELPVVSPKVIDLELDYYPELEPTIDDLSIGSVVPNYFTYDEDKEYATSSVLYPEQELLSSNKIECFSGIVVQPTKSFEEDSWYEGLYYQPGEVISSVGHAYLVVDIYTCVGYIFGSDFDINDLPEGYNYFTYSTDKYELPEGKEDVEYIIYKYLGEIEYEEIEEVDITLYPEFVEYFSNFGPLDYGVLMEAFVMNDSDPKYIFVGAELYYQEENGDLILIEDPEYFMMLPSYKYYIKGVFGTGIKDDYENTFDYSGYRFADVVKNNSDCYSIKEFTGFGPDYDNQLIEIIFELPGLVQEEITSVDVAVNQDFLNAYMQGIYDYYNLLVINEENPKYVIEFASIYYKDASGELKLYDYSENNYQFIEGVEYYINALLLTGITGNGISLGKYKFADNITNKTEGYVIENIQLDVPAISVTYKLPELSFEKIDEVEFTINPEFLEIYEIGNVIPSDYRKIILLHNDERFVLGTGYLQYYFDNIENAYTYQHSSYDKLRYEYNYFAYAEYYIDNPLYRFDESLNQTTENYIMTVEYGGACLVVKYLLPKLEYEEIEVIDITINQEFMANFRPGNDPYSTSALFDFNDEEPKYYIAGMMLAYETEDGLEEVELGSTFEIGVKYYAMVQLYTCYDEFEKYIFADNVTTVVKEGYTIEAVHYEAEYNYTFIILTYEIGELIITDLNDEKINISLENSLTYNGEEQLQEIKVAFDGVELVEGLDYIVSDNVNTNAGTYKLTVTGIGLFKGEVEVEYVIAKATYDMTGITFADVTVTYDGAEYKTLINGTLPEGVTVAYTDNVATNAGVYNAVAKFTGDANYNVIEDMTATITINKATYDMIGITFNDVTVTYDGAEHKTLINGTLPEGVTVTYTNNAATNAGVYNAVAKFTGDANYNVIADMTATLTINKIKVELPELTTSFVYNGSLHTAVNAHDLYTVEEGSATNAGEYEAVITLKDAVNYEWTTEFSGNVVWVIEKASYDMSGISFKDVTVKYDGNEYKVEITGTLPSGVTVSYTDNKGTDAGVYNAVAKFSGDANYNAIPDMTATLTIKKDAQSYVNPESNKEEVIVSSEEGIDPNKELFIELIEMVETAKDFTEFLERNQRVAVAYNVKLLLGDTAVQPDSTLIFKILIPTDLRNKDFGIMHVHNGNETSMLEYEIDGDYVIFETDKLSEFVFVYEMGSLLWVAIILAVIVVLEAACLVFLINKKKQYKTMKMASVYPPFIFGMFVPEWHLVLIIVLAVMVVLLAATDVVYALSIFGGSNSKVEEELEVLEETPVVETEEEIEKEEETKQENTEVATTEEADEEETMRVWDEETHSYTIIRIIKSYTARLIQSSNEIKDYYDVIKNELTTYKKVKSRISFKYESFKLGKNNIARLQFRGKTLCLYLALNPADYESSKYKIEDMSSVSSSSEVPTMYRINLPRRVEYAKELIADLMNKIGAERTETDFFNYSINYPYEDNETLLENGLIRKSVKVVGNGVSTKTIVNPVHIVKKVSISEVNSLISDDQVIDLICQSSRIADRTKKAIINIDTIAKYFNENETVTLEEIKNRVPNFNKNTTYYKVLAHGTLDKPLTVDADDFSIEAEKMIIVTGGKVLVSKTK